MRNEHMPHSRHESSDGMKDTAVTGQVEQKLDQLVAGMATSVGSALGSLIEPEVNVSVAGELRLTTAADWLQNHPGQHAIVRGRLHGQSTEHPLCFIFDGACTSTLANILAGSTEDAIEEKRAQGEISEEDMQALVDLGSKLCAEVTSHLAQKEDPAASLELQDQILLDPGQDATEQLGSGSLVTCRLQVDIGELAASPAYLLVDAATAENWNGCALDLAGPERPAAPLRGNLATYVIEKKVMATVREASRTVGLEIFPHSRTEIPNPSAHKGQVVLLEIPVGEDRRFEWAKRLKQHQDEIKVALLIHSPSRGRVLQGYLTQADVILGWPCKPETLHARLDTLLPPAAEDTVEEAQDPPAPEES